MAKLLSGSLLACCACTVPLRPAMAQPGEFSFGVIAHPLGAVSDESQLREAIAATDADSLAFVVADGIKTASEPCSDTLYLHRKALLAAAKNGLVLSLAGTDWSECRNAHGRSAAMERLNRVRELFFGDDFSLGSSRIPVIRQSTTAKFRSYAENARWEIGGVMFATVNLPGDNNHYRPEAGRNSEFEDRLIANRDWLQRVFKFAARKKMQGVVLFCDGDPLAEPGLLERLAPGTKRDGFTETRKYIRALAAKFPGKVLVVHNRISDQPPAVDGIVWRNNVGNLEVGVNWLRLTVNPSNPALFAISNESFEANSASK